MHTVLFISGWEIMYKIFRLCSKVPTHINCIYDFMPNYTSSEEYACETVTEFTLYLERISKY